MTANFAHQSAFTPRLRRVLVVEDDEDISESMASILEDAGYEVSVCFNGKDALDLLGARSVDAIVLDLMMPVMNGWEFVTVKHADPTIAQIPVVAVSADGSAQATAIRADAYLSKPFDADELIAAVRQLLLEADQRKLRQSIDETERIGLLQTIAAEVGREIDNPLAFLLANIELTERTLSCVDPEMETLRSACRSTQDAERLAHVVTAFARIREQLQNDRQSLEQIRLVARNLQSFARRQSRRMNR
jgi:DNA-binding response OmpR family regulator